jgi:HEAT repeats
MARTRKVTAATTGPSGPAIMGWGLGSLVVLAFVVSGALLWTHVKKTCGLVDATHTRYANKRAYLSAIEDLGGRESAARRLGWYLRAPGQISKNKLWATKALGYLHEDGLGEISALLSIARHEDEKLREAALMSIGNIGPGAGICGQLLTIIHTANEKESVRSMAVWSLCRLRPEDESKKKLMIDALCRVVRDRSVSYYARAEAIERLGQFGADARATLEVVKGAMGDEHPWTRVEAARATYRIDHSLASEVLPVLVAADEETDGKEERAEFEEAQRRIGQVIEEMAADVKPQLQQMATLKSRGAGYIARNAHRLVKCRPRSPEPEWKREVRYKLGRRIDVEFVEVPARRAMQHIGRLVGVRIRFAKSCDDGNYPVTFRMSLVSGELALLWTGKLARIYSARPTKDGLLLGGHEGPM